MRSSCVYILLISFTGCLGNLNSHTEHENHIEHQKKNPPVEIKLARHFLALSEKRHPFYKDGLTWLQARDYISSKMHEYGIKNITKQHFNTTVHDNEVEGVNIIGIKEGNNDNDSVIVIGADYSTTILGNHLKDNTGGVAALLETIHMFLHYTLWERYYQNYTVIFVAFDLNTREMHNSGMGKPGSYHFIHKWLIPFLTSPKQRAFEGAIILDSVTTFNPKPDTQLTRQGFEEAMSDAYHDINNRSKAGDFIGLLFSSYYANHPIVSAFDHCYNIERIYRNFRLQNMEIDLDFGLLHDDVYNLISHQSHFYFWTNEEAGITLPSFLIFDTDEDRVDPTPDVCEIQGCDLQKFLTDDRLRFMEKTTRTLVQTLLTLQTTYNEDTSSSSKSVPSVILVLCFSVIGTLIVRN